MSILHPALLEMLCCPETRQDLTEAAPETVQIWNEKIQAGLVRNRAEQVITEPLDGLLIRADGDYGYAVRREIPVMLVEEALRLRS